MKVKGLEVLTHDGVPVSYASCPTETVHYVSAHHNETLFVIVVLRLDFTYNSNYWGVGHPQEDKNGKNWPLIQPGLADQLFKPQKNHILAAVNNFSNLLRISYSSPLFHLKTANAIQEWVRFHNTGSSLVPGVIVMSIDDGHEGVPGLSQLEPMRVKLNSMLLIILCRYHTNNSIVDLVPCSYSYVVVIINSCPCEISFLRPALRARALQLHPIRDASVYLQ